MKSNIAEYLPYVAKKYPNDDAILCPISHKNGIVEYSKITYLELDNLSNAYSAKLTNDGITKGTKVLIMLKPSIEFIAIVFSIFKIGAVPVLIDPGMGRKNFLNCVRETLPEAMIAIAPVYWFKLFIRKPFKSVKNVYSIGAYPPLGVQKLDKLKNNKNIKFTIPKTLPEDLAAILFTTGSTGPPKGVEYSHRIFTSQVEIISKLYGTGHHEVDMPAFPLFGLFSVAMGMKFIIPKMNPSKQAQVNPERIIEAINQNKVSFSFGSPAFWNTVANYCISRNIRLDSLKKVLMAGAPVTDELHKKVKKIMGEGGDTYVPYGATESLPIASFTGSEMIAQTANLTKEGAGFCVGYPINEVEIKIISATNKAINNWDDIEFLENTQRGEIIVKGPIVTSKYHNKKEATQNSKIVDKNGDLWHRMGDVGYFDNMNRLWFCGRKAHRVLTNNNIFYTVCCEAIFNNHSKVFRSALVGIKQKDDVIPIIIIESKDNISAKEKADLILELKEIGQRNSFTKPIKDFLFHPSFPVDIRHNAKIFREKLAIWAETQL